MTDLEYLEGFQHWLQSKNPNEVVGIACKANACPIATYLSKTTKKHTVVTYDAIEVEGVARMHSDLSEAFVGEIDSLANGEKTLIYAGEALEILVNLQDRHKENLSKVTQ